MIQRKVLAIIVLFWVFSRVFGFYSLVPHNDEAIYTQYAQLISVDWGTNKYISLDGFFWGDFKEPLPFWLSALTVNVFKNPYHGVRLVVVFFSLVGLFFTWKFFSRLCGERVGILTALLIIFSEYFFYFDSIFLSEPFVYALGSVVLYYGYLFVCERRWWALLFSNLAFTLALLCKQSILIWWALGMALILLLPLWHDQEKVRGFKSLMLDLLLWSLHLAVAKAVYALVIPDSFLAIRDLSPPQLLVRNIHELMGIGLGEIVAGLRYYFATAIALDVYSVPLFVVCGIGIFMNRGSRKIKNIFFLLFFLWIISFLPQVLLMKHPLLRHFGMGFYYWYGLLAFGVIATAERITRPALGRGLYILITGLVLFQGWQLCSDVVHHHQTRAGIAESPDTANGLGMDGLIEKIQGLQKGILVYDVQWGMPGTVIQTLGAFYPQLALVPLMPATVEEFKRIHEATRARREEGYLTFTRKTLRDKVLTVKFGPTDSVYFVFDEGRSRDPRFGHYAEVASDPVLCKEKSVITKIFRGRELRGSKIIVCRMD